MMKKCQKINLQEPQRNRNATANNVNLIRTGTVAIGNVGSKLDSIDSKVQEPLLNTLDLIFIVGKTLTFKWEHRFLPFDAQYW